MAGKEQVEGTTGMGLLRPAGGSTLADELDRLFEQMMQGIAPGAMLRLWGHRPGPATELWMPDLDIFEREGRVVIRADVPGFEKEDIRVSVQERHLVIEGRRQERTEVRQQGYYQAQQFSNQFSRRIGLPREIDQDAIQATYQEGVLEIILPRHAGEEGGRP